MQFRLLILISLISLISITGLYAYAVSLDVTPIAQVNDDSDTLLNGAMDIAIATIDDSTYAVVSSNKEHGIQIIDISDPTNPTAVGSLDDGTDSGLCTLSPSLAEGEKCLDGVKGVAIYTISSGSTYAVVAGENDDGIEIIDISEPSNPTSVSRLADGTDNGECTVANEERCLDGVRPVSYTHLTLPTKA